MAFYGRDEQLFTNLAPALHRPLDLSSESVKSSMNRHSSSLTVSSQEYHQNVSQTEPHSKGGSARQAHLNACVSKYALPLLS